MTKKETKKDMLALCNENIRGAIIYLLKNESFFAGFSVYVQKKISREIPTAAVFFDKEKKQLFMLFNPDFVGNLSVEQTVGLMIHEFYHIIFGHVITRAPVPGMEQIWNAATDLAINSLILTSNSDRCGFLPPDGLIPGEGPFKGYLPLKSSELYFQEILKDENIKKQATSGGMEGFDSHEMWEELKGRSASECKQNIQKALEKGIKNASASNNGWGSVSKEMQRKIFASMKNQIKWEDVLRSFIKTSVISDKYSSIRRINKRYPRIHAGKKRRYHANILISIDESYSVDDELFTKFWSQFSGLSKFADFTIAPFDTEVFEEGVFKWKKGKNHPPERRLTGGTDFNAPTKWANERNFDAHVIFSDLEAPFPIKSKHKRCWVTSERHFNNALPEFKSTREKIIIIK